MTNLLEDGDESVEEDDSLDDLGGGGNSIEKFQPQFWLEKSLEIWI